MTNLIKKSTAFLLLLCCIATVVLNLGIIAGVDISTAADASSELWMLEGYDYVAANRVRKKIHETKTGVTPWIFTNSDGKLDAYIPVAALTGQHADFDCSYTVDGSKITIVNFTNKTFVMYDNSPEYTKDGVAQTPLKHPPVLVDGEPYLNIEGIKAAVQGSVKYYINEDIGTVVLSKTYTSYNSTYTSLKAQIKEMDNLLYDLPTADELYADIEANIGVETHPKLLVNQDKFDSIRAAYEKSGILTEDEVKFQGYVNAVLSTANAYFARAFEETETGAKFKEGAENYFRQPYYLYDENGNRLYGVDEYEMPDGTVIKLTEYWQTVSPWQQSSPNGDGYDLGDRSNLDLVSRYLRFFAFAWQMTGDNKWVDAFYLAAMEFSKWEHWGEGHYLDCSDGAVEFALGFDWIYPAFEAMGAEGEAKLRQMAETLFVLGVEVGYEAATRRQNTSAGVDVAYTSRLTNVTNENLLTRLNNVGDSFSGLHARDGSGGNWHFAWTNNWQSVCVSGMVITALAIMEYDDMTDVCTGLIEKLLPRVEYSVHHYAPDGSYTESPSYWEYSTRTFMLYLAALESSAGTSYGILDTIGLHESYYFALNVTDNFYYAWNFHDGSRTRVNSSTFYMAAELFDDPALAKARYNMINSDLGIGVEMYDLLYYNQETIDNADFEAPLDYYGKNIETVTMRSSWDKYDIFTGLHAGPNNVVHGDIDSGNFYLTTGNYVWFGDRGSEDYNVSNFVHGDYFKDTYRYLYHNKSIISHNSVYVVGNSKVPRGQSFTSLENNEYSKITTMYSEENGAYTIADLTPSFNPLVSAGSTLSAENTVTTSARRGLLFTNSRRTIVIQDEVSFTEANDFIWSASSQLLVSDSISEDGRTVYIDGVVNGKRTTLRATLLTDDPNLKFKIITDREEPYLTYLDTTINDGKIVTRTQSGNQKTSDPYNRLIIEAFGVTEFNVAVVLEFIEDKREAVGYEYTEMDNWEVSSDEWLNEANQWIEDEKPPEYKYKKSDLVKAISQYNSASTLKEKHEIVLKLKDIIADIDTTISGIGELIETSESYISSVNIKIAKINQAYREGFFSFLKTN